MRISGAWRRIFAPAEKTVAAGALYEQIVAQSRRPEFYLEGGVADSLDGRFDLMSLHVFLVLRRLKEEGQGKLSQALFDTFFHNLDVGLREMGVGDLSVGKKIRQMAEAFYGRVAAYDAALSAPDEKALVEALQRNLYRGSIISHNTLNRLANYVRWQADNLGRQSGASLARGDVVFEPFDD